MKATDLMIGDWVLISVWGCKPFPSKVTSINYNSYQGKDFVDWIDTEDEEEIGMYAVQPIPLTQEILEKNEFSREKSNTASMFAYSEYRDNKGDFDLYICNGVRRGSSCGEINEFQFTAIRFVHELQHALKLCKIEKEIKL